MHCTYFSTTSETVSYIDFLAEKWISWKWIETPGDTRLDERRRADFRWTLMFWLIWWSGWWWREMQQVGPPQLYVLKNAATPKLNIWDLCSSFFVTNNPLQEQWSNAAHTMCSNTSLWTVCGYQVPNTTWHTGNKSNCLSTYQIKVRSALALQAHVLRTRAG